MQCCTEFVDQLAAPAPSPERCWTVDIRHWTAEWALWTEFLLGLNHFFNNFEHRKGKLPGFFSTVIGSRCAFLYTCLRHIFMLYPDDVIKSLANPLRIEEVNKPPWSMLTGHGYIQHVRGKWRKKYCLRYHMYLVPEELELKGDLLLRKAPTSV